MRIDAIRAAALKAVIEDDLNSIHHMNQRLRSLPQPISEERALAFAALQLHNLYNALENSFSQISRTFENHITDPAHWHQELLGKVFLDIPPVRPAVLPAPLKPLLKDLCGFRHFLRHGYDYELDAGRVNPLCQAWLKDGPQVVAALQRFAHALAAVAEGSAGQQPA
ncbi:MAG: hypothetical protein FJ387_20990 [Verrucomicrobia bacterium]|nr:hypothetical protein [Verrucomicrobiota bacterium]